MPKKLTPIQIAAVVIVLAILGYVLYQNYLVAAIVNGKPIGRLGIVTELEKQSGKKLLDTVITQELIKEAATKANITVSQSDTDKELKTIEATVKAQGGTLDEALAQKGMTKADLTSDIQLQVMVQKLVKADDIKITDAEVTEYMKDNPEQFPANAKEKPDTNQIKESLKQQKLQTKIQSYITDLHTKAKITYFGSYK